MSLPPPCDPCLKLIYDFLGSVIKCEPLIAHILICPLRPLIIHLRFLLHLLGVTLCHLRAFVLAVFQMAPLGTFRWP